MNFKSATLLTPPLALLFIFSSCGKVNETIQRDIFITPPGVEFKIPIIAATVSGTTFGTFEVKDLNLEALIKEQTSKFGAGNIKSAKLKEFKLELLNATVEKDDEEDNDIDDDNNVSNIEDVSIFILAAGQVKTLVAGTSPSNTESITLIIPPVANIELKDFLNTLSFSYSIEGKARRQTTKELSVKATITYTLTVAL